MPRFKVGDAVYVHCNNPVLSRLVNPLTITREPCEGDELWYGTDMVGQKWALNSRSTDFQAFEGFLSEEYANEPPF